MTGERPRPLEAAPLRPRSVRLAALLSRLLLGLCCGVVARPMGVAAEGPEVIPAGAGSYLRGLPEGASGPPREIVATSEVAGRPMPSNDWWSSLAWLRLSEAMYPHPLAVKAEAGGLRVAYPGARLTA